ncbi:MAG: sigma-70 family RNA polymerase sigma factor [Anaerohalosphaera sp.]|nr:sigma-70 family RNA polymerase sigma factor [Anaerohalosphaera sp.]
MTNQDKSSSDMSDDKGQRFMKLYMAVQRRLYGFTLSLVPNQVDADDIVQETASVMWDKFDDFEPGTDFAAWALCIARYRVMTYRQKDISKRKRFSSQSIETIDNAASSDEKKESARQAALRGCMKKLEEKDRQILYLRYEMGATLRNVAERLDLSINTLYSRLGKIHAVLLNCIRKKVAQEETV